MLRTFYRWRYARRERRPTFSFHDRNHENFGPAFGHHLSKHASLSLSESPFDRRQRRQRYFRIILSSIGILFLGWIVFETLIALSFF